MDTTESILVAILASFLALFLLIGILIAVQVLRLVKSLKAIAEKAEKLVNSAEAVGQVFRQAAVPAGALNLLRNVVSLVADHKRSKEKSENE